MSKMWTWLRQRSKKLVSCYEMGWKKFVKLSCSVTSMNLAEEMYQKKRGNTVIKETH